MLAIAMPVYSDEASSELESTAFDWTPPPLPPVGINDYGVGGILDIPSARMPEEGQFTFTYSRKDVQDIYALGYQLTPRLEMAFRYGMPDYRRRGGRSTLPAGFADRSIEVKYRFVDETPHLPAIVVGIRDLGGAQEDGGAEYIVASKRINDIDLSFGVGWGALAQRAVFSNPLVAAGLDLGNRTNETLGSGGLFRSNIWFRGPKVGVFGGVSYNLNSRTRLSVAYNSDSYDFAVKGLGALSKSEPVSVGLSWVAAPGLVVELGRQQGSSLSFRVSASLDTARMDRPKRPNGFGHDPFKTAKVRNLDDDIGWWPRFVNDVEASGILVPEAQIEKEKTLIVRYRNNAYRLEADAVNRVLTLAEVYAPANVSEIVASGEVIEYPTHSIRYQRTGLDVPPVLMDPHRISIEEPVAITRADFTTRFKYPNYKLNFGLGPRLYLFDPDNPLLYQFALRVGGEVDFGGGWRLNGNWTQNLTTQLDQIVRQSDSQLPRVRTEQKNYLKDGASGIDSLVLTRRGKIGQQTYYQAFGGLLEEMYAGVGGEILWRPFDQRWAVGLSGQAVRQRDFDKLFGLRDYQTVTGHLSFYWATPIYDFDVAIHAGRYLAGDVGATLEVQKRLPNGWSVGAFATLTDVPFSVFGEGSFDKGIFFAAPLDFFSTSNTRERYRTSIRLINRDGGRPVEGSVRSLWDQLRDTQFDRLERFSDRMMPE